MTARLAVKLLTKTDLSLFEDQFQMRPNSRQKSVNINALIFERFYPEAKELLRERREIRINLQLDIIGPGGRPVQTVTRKILRQQKNWRLNGETINAPPEDPNRYSGLRAGDIAVMRFEGAALPDLIELTVLSSRDANDKAAYTELRKLLGPRERSMTEITESEQSALFIRATESNNALLADIVGETKRAEVLESLAQGDPEAYEVLRKRTSRKISREEITSARIEAGIVGRDGEEIVAEEFQRLVDSGVLNSFVWVSDTDACAPLDFRLEKAGGYRTKVDVKSTKYGFSRKFHISIAELFEAADSAEPYHICRVYNLNDEGGCLRMSEDIRALACSIRDSLKLPKGVGPEGFVISPECLLWEEEHKVIFAEDYDIDEIEE